MSFSDGLIGIILMLGTGSKIYGMLKRKSWFWEPEKDFNSNPMLSLDNSMNSILHPIFGKWGVAIVNSIILIILWWAYIKLTFWE